MPTEPPSSRRDRRLVFSELGVVLLLFVVGLQTRLSDMRAGGGRAVSVGISGVVLPFVGGFALGEALGENVETSLFLGAALMATSAGITSAVLVDLGAGDRQTTRTILGAAVVDDVLALVLLSVVVGIAGGEGVSITSVALLLIAAVAFIGAVAVGGSRLLARHPGALTAPSFSESGLLPAVLLCLGLAAVAGEIGLAAIIGAFLAGMTRGMPGRERATIAVGMVPRGEVGVIVAGIGSAAGVIDGELFAVIVGMAVLTTLVTPPVLRRLTEG